jgi:hypothetical protein
MIGTKSWAEIKAESKEGWKEMKAMSFKALLTQCLAGFSLAMLAGFALAAIILH